MGKHFTHTLALLTSGVRSCSSLSSHTEHQLHVAPLFSAKYLRTTRRVHWHILLLYTCIYLGNTLMVKQLIIPTLQSRCAILTSNGYLHRCTMLTFNGYLNRCTMLTFNGYLHRCALLTFNGYLNRCALLTFNGYLHRWCC